MYDTMDQTRVAQRFDSITKGKITNDCHFSVPFLLGTMLQTLANPRECDLDVIPTSTFAETHYAITAEELCRESLIRPSVAKNKDIALSLLLMVKHNVPRYEQPGVWYSDPSLPDDPSITSPDQLPDEDVVDLGMKLYDASEEDRNAAFAKLAEHWNLAIPDDLPDKVEVSFQDAGGILSAPLGTVSQESTQNMTDVQPSPAKCFVDLDFLPERLMEYCSKHH